MSFLGKGGGRVFEGCRVLLAAAKGATSAAGKRKSPAASSSTAKSSKSKRSSSSSSSIKQTAGILKEAPVSPALASFLGAPQASRTQAVKGIWDYIKLHNLQNPTNKKEILCDEKLKTIFDGKSKVGFLEVSKLISLHFVKPA